MELLFILLFSIYQFISRIFMLSYPEVVYFVVPFGLFIAFLLTVRNRDYFPLSTLVIIPTVIVLLEAHLNFLAVVDRTVILYSALIGMGLAYLLLSKRMNLLSRKKISFVFVSGGIFLGLVLGVTLLLTPQTLLSFYSLKFPVLVILFPLVFAMAEEIVFRGLFVETVWNETRSWIAVIAPSLIAASFAITYEPMIIAGVFIFHVILSSWYVLTRSLWSSFLCNATAKLMFSIYFYVTTYSLFTSG